MIETFIVLAMNKTVVQLKDAVILRKTIGQFDKCVLYYLPITYAVADSEVHGFRRAPLIYEHCII